MDDRIDLDLVRLMVHEGATVEEIAAAVEAPTSRIAAILKDMEIETAATPHPPDSDDADDGFLATHQLADFFGVSQQSIMLWHKKGMPLAVERYGPSSHRWDEKACEAWHNEYEKQKQQRYDSQRARSKTTPDRKPPCEKKARLLVIAAEERDKAIRLAHETYRVRIETIEWVFAKSAEQAKC